MKKLAGSGIVGSVALGAAWAGAHLTAIAPFLPARYQPAAAALAGALVAVAALHATPPGKISTPK